MALYYLFAGLLFALVLLSIGIQAGKLSEGNTGFPDYKPLTKQERYVSYARDILDLLLYLALFAAPMFVNAPDWAKLLLVPVLIWFAIEVPREIWNGIKEFWESPGAAVFLFVAEAVQFGLVVTAAKVVYL